MIKIFFLALLNFYLSVTQSFSDVNYFQLILNTTEDTLKFDEYLSNQQLFSFLKNFSKQNPDLVKYYEIGRSSNNQSLSVLALSNFKENSDLSLIPSIKLVGNRFGNEAIGRQLLVYLAKLLVENYNLNKLAYHILNSTEIHMLFSMNPDGFDSANEGDCKSNNNLLSKFPDQFDQDSHLLKEYKNDTLINLWIREGLNLKNLSKNKKHENVDLEVEAVERWTLMNNFLVSLEIRSGLMGVFYPYSSYKENFTDDKLNQVNFMKNKLSLTPDNEVFEIIAYNYAWNHPSMNISECNPLKSFPEHRYPVLNSAFYQFTYGSMQDYNYFFANCFDLSVQLSCCAYPKKNNLKKIWLENKVPLINFMKFVHMGIKGVITDNFTEHTLEGVFIHVAGNQHITMSNHKGEYYRLLPNGVYNMTFELFGYKNYCLNNLVIINFYNQATVINITLHETNTYLNDELNLPNVIAAERLEAKNSNEIQTPNELELEKDFLFKPFIKYHNYEEMVGFLAHYHHTYPNITRLYSIGTTKYEKIVYVFEISKKPGYHQLLNPEFKYVANVYGDDWIGKEMLLLLIKSLLENYSRNEEIKNLIETTRLHFVPCLNPDGFEISNFTYVNSLRNNLTEITSLTEEELICELHKASSFDNPLDNTFPDPFIERKTYANNDQVLNIMTWLDSNEFILSGTLFDGQLVAKYPYNSYKYDNISCGSRSSDDLLFQELAQGYSLYNEKMKNSDGCLNEKCSINLDSRESLKNGTLNGADMNKRHGTMTDYNYVIASILDVSLYISCTKKPPEDLLLSYWVDNRKSLINFIKQVHQGVKGKVYEEDTGLLINEIEIVIEVEGIEKKMIFLTKGDYFRLLLPGKYNITILIEKYESKSKIIEIQKGNVTISDFYLKKAKNFKKNLTSSKRLTNETKVGNEIDKKIDTKVNEKIEKNFKRKLDFEEKKRIFYYIVGLTIFLFLIYCSYALLKGEIQIFQKFLSNKFTKKWFLNNTHLRLSTDIELSNVINIKRSKTSQLVNSYVDETGQISISGRETSQETSPDRVTEVLNFEDALDDNISQQTTLDDIFS